jgi:hypothetical protein
VIDWALKGNKGKLNMSEETVRIILAICVLIAVYVLTRKYHTWKTKRAFEHIIEDLKKKEALAPSSAVELPYARVSMFRMGVRDHRPKAVEYLVFSNIVGKTDSGKYYLKDTRIGPPI